MKLDKKKILIGTICFVTIGLLSNGLIGGLPYFVVPFIFGLVLPFTNWRGLGKMKVIKLTFVAFTSLVLFYLSFFAAMTLGKDSLVVVAIICGLAGVGQYLATSVFIISLDKGVIQLGLILLLGLISIPTAELLTMIVGGDRIPSDFFFPGWTILVGLGMSLGQRKKEHKTDKSIC